MNLDFKTLTSFTLGAGRKAARISAQESKLESHTPMKNGCHLTAVP